MSDDVGEAFVRSMFFVLLLLFSIFVLGDVVTTVWLTHNDPAGISDEGNPLGVLLCLKYGVAGLFLGKMVFFLPFSVMIITAESRYRNVKWFGQASEAVVLGLIGYSLVVFLNNITAIIVLNALKGWSFLLQILPAMRFFIILFCLALEVAVLDLCGLKSWMRSLEVVIGTILITVPLLLYEPLYTFLSGDPLLLTAYIASMMIILGIAFYVTDEIVREKKSRRNISLK